MSGRVDRWTMAFGVVLMIGLVWLIFNLGGDPEQREPATTYVPSAAEVDDAEVNVDRSDYTTTTLDPCELSVRARYLDCPAH